MQRKTKIICTMGPAVNTPEAIRGLMQAGMDVARLNFSHGTHAQHGAVIEMLKAARAEMKQPLAIMLDTKGPEIRVGKDWVDCELKAHQRIWLGSASGIPVVPKAALNCVRPGMTILFDDGYLIARALQCDPVQGVEIEILNDGVLKTSKSINLPGAQVDLPALTEQDQLDLAFGVKMGIDLVAASFVRSADHVLQIRQWLDSLGAPDIQVIAKIENAEGIQNFDEIVQVADGIMVARGDLGVEMPLAQVPRLQKMMIRRCFQASKPVVTATQMLESMIHHPRPTRAEVSDVANAIYDSTSAVMLSGETAMGAYPIEAVTTMRDVIEETERDINFRDVTLVVGQQFGEQDIPTAVALAGVKTAYASGAKAIFAFTNSGTTARLISRLRPAMTILAFTPIDRRFNQMALLWGVTPCRSQSSFGRSQAFTAACEEARARQIVELGDLVVVIAGTPFGVSGSTNSMIVETIGDVVARGLFGGGDSVSGPLVLKSNLEAHHGVKSILLSDLDGVSEACLSKIGGLILMHRTQDNDQRYRELLHQTQQLGLATLVISPTCPLQVEPGTIVTLDPRRGRVFRGDVIL